MSEKKISPPELLPFPLGLSGPRPRFRWKGTPRAKGYQISLKELDSGQTIFFYDLKGTEFIPPNDLPAGRYRCYAKAVLDGGTAVSRGIILTIHSEDDYSAAVSAYEIEIGQRDEAHQRFILREDDFNFEENVRLKEKSISENKSIADFFPSTILLNIGHNCNIQCIMCPSGKKKDNRVLSESFIQDLDAYLPYVDDLLVSGGEPLLYPDMVKGLLHKVEEHPRAMLSLHSNGTLMTKKWAKILGRGKVRNISFSIDGARAQTYESIRGGAKFKRVVNGLDMVAGSAVPPAVSMTFVVMRRNWREIPAYIELGRKFGCSEFVFQPLRTQMFPELERECVLHDKSICLELLAQFQELEQTAKEQGFNLADKVRPFIYNCYPELAKSPAEFRYLPDYILETGVEENFGLRLKNLFLQNKPDMSAPRVTPRIDPEEFAATRTPFFCPVPFENLNVDVEDSFICCSTLREFYYLAYEPTWRHFRDIWNCEVYARARRLMLKGLGASRVCHPVCAWYNRRGYDKKRDGYLWV